MDFRLNIRYKIVLSNSPRLEPLLVLKQNNKIKMGGQRNETRFHHVVRSYSATLCSCLKNNIVDPSNKLIVTTLDNSQYAYQSESCHYSSPLTHHHVLPFSFARNHI